MIPQHGTLEISRSRMAHNIRLLRERLGTTQVCATVKADAYGHGLAPITQILHAANVQWLAVYSLDEALDLAPIPWLGLLVLAPFILADKETLSPPHLAALRGQIRLNIIDAPTAHRLSAALVAAGIQQPLNVHIQIDTGLTRSGLAPAKLADLAQTIATLPALRLEGIFAHLSHGDVPGHDTVHHQAQILHQFAGPLKARLPHLMLHLQNSAGTWHLHDPGLDMARVGIALYGLQPSTADPIPDLQPIARVTAPILAIHEVPANTGVGYGHTFITRRPSRLAIVPVGYADGYPRLLSSHPAAIAQLHDTDVPVIARVSMDQVILDITGLPAAGLGDTVTLISWHPEKPNSLDRMADAIGTIGYELATHLGARLNRVIVP